MSNSVQNPIVRPIFQLKVFHIDFFQINNPKLLEIEHAVKLINVNDLPIIFNTNANVRFFDNEKVLQCNLKVNVDTNVKGPPINLATIEVSFDFEIQNHMDFKDGNVTLFPSDFLAHLSNISMSTTRGLLASKFSTTYLQNLIMPIVWNTSAQIKAPDKKPTTKKKKLKN